MRDPEFVIESGLHSLIASELCSYDEKFVKMYLGTYDVRLSYVR